TGVQTCALPITTESTTTAKTRRRPPATAGAWATDSTASGRGSRGACGEPGSPAARSAQVDDPVAGAPVGVAVRDQDHHPVLGGGTDVAHHGLGGRRVRVCRGLVEQEDVGAREQGPRHCEPLTFPSGE